MVEMIGLKWRIKSAKKNGKQYHLHYISVPGRSAVFLIDYEPYLDPVNKLIAFKPKQNNAQSQGKLIRLRWRIKSTKKNGKEYRIYYISIPITSALFLLDYDPYLDPQNKLIVFKPKQNAQSQPQSQ